MIDHQEGRRRYVASLKGSWESRKSGAHAAELDTVGFMVRLVVNIAADNLERGIEFYRDAIGLTLARHLFDGSVAEMRGASATIYLAAKLAGSLPATGSVSSRDYRRHWTPVHLDFVVEDIEAAVEQAEHAGAKLERGIEAHESWREAALSDPFGNGFCLLEGWPP